MTERRGAGGIAGTTVAALLLIVPLLLGAGVAGLLSTVGFGDGISADGDAAASRAAERPGQYSLRSIPPLYVALYQQAAASSCAGLPWTVLAAIGTVESGNGTANAPGVHSGANSAGAEGPMQFEPGTFAEYATPVPPGGANPSSPYDPADAIYAAARDLCANGAEDMVDLHRAIFNYNHAEWYVDDVLLIAGSYAREAAPERASTAQ